MHILRTLPLLILGGVLFLGCSCGSDKEQFKHSSQGGETPQIEEQNDYGTLAFELYSTIKACYGINDGPWKGLYRENYPSGSGDPSSSYLWPYDGLVSGLACLNALDREVGYTEAVEGFERYFCTRGEVGGYASGTNGTSGQGDRFYDDNSIVGLNLVEAYKQTGQKKYLDRAARIVEFLRSGRDETLGYALWWNESYKNVPGNDSSNKPACANGYALWFLTSYYEVCPLEEKESVLKFAKEEYSWLRSTLRDDDGLYWNSLQADGSINKTKWTYNTGALIAGGVKLYKATSQKSYLEDAKTSADGAYGYFVKPYGSLNRCWTRNDPWFSVKLFKSFIELKEYYPKCEEYIKSYISFTDYALSHGRMPSGLFYEDWTGSSPNPSRDKQLLMQDAALESLGLIALYL